MTTSSLALTSALAVAALAALASPAMAGGSTKTIGARERGFQPALVGEFWIGRVGLSAEAGIGFTENEQPDRSAGASSSSRTDGGSSLQAGAALYYVLARGKRSQLSAGLRYGYGRAHVSYDEGRGGTEITSYDEFTAPIRVEVWVVDRVSIYAELGMGVRLARTEYRGDPPFDGVGPSSEELFMFGDPLGNSGISFHF